MTIDDRSRVLAEFGVDPSAVDLAGRGKDETYCLTHESDGWHIFFSERGTRVEERVFAAEWQATDAFMIQIAADPQTRLHARRFPGSS
jgi:hypothetical protein